MIIIINIGVFVTAPDNNFVTLADLPIGARAKIARTKLPADLRDRLLEMGLTPDTPVQVLHRHIGSDPLALWLRGYRLALRRKEAALIAVVPCASL